jgi:hypothetical protein
MVKNMIQKSVFKIMGIMILIFSLGGCIPYQIKEVYREQGRDDIKRLIIPAQDKAFDRGYQKGFRAGKKYGREKGKQELLGQLELELPTVIKERLSTYIEIFKKTQTLQH